VDGSVEDTPIPQFPSLAPSQCLIYTMYNEAVIFKRDSNVANLLPILPTFVRDARYQGDTR
jgi:hypothetical protein